MTLDEQQAICDAATPGPWEAGEKHGMDCVWFDVEDATGEEILSAPTEMNPRIVKPSEIEAAKAINRQRVADLEFCATARTEWPALIEAHRKALAEIERLKAAGKVLAKFAKRHRAGYMSDMTPKACKVFEEDPSGT